LSGADDVAATSSRSFAGDRQQPADRRSSPQGGDAIAVAIVVYVGPPRVGPPSHSRGRRAAIRAPRLGCGARPRERERHQLRAVEDRIGFEVSIDAAERSNLRISSRMLTVAGAWCRRPHDPHHRPVAAPQDHARADRHGIRGRSR
jgi:hypothetical protein